MRSAKMLEIGAIIAAATVGDGMFALPFVFAGAGWLAAIFYLVILGGLVVAAHAVYLATLEEVGEKQRLLGLSAKYLGRTGFWAGFLAIAIGLTLSILAYLLLGTQFIRLAAPSVPYGAALAVFWIAISIPLFLENSSVRELELAGIAATSCAVLLIFFSGAPSVFTGAAFANIPVIDWGKFFLPFGAVLFSLAGWTGIEPAYEARRHEKAEEEAEIAAEGTRALPWRALFLGTGTAVILYAAFALGVFGSVGVITPDTASGLVSWPFWKKEVFAIMGLIAVGTVCIPMARELRNSLEKDLRWNRAASRGLIMAVPLAAVLLGFNNFLAVVGIAGGVFCSIQYLLILSVGRRALRLSAGMKFLLDLAAAAFIIAAVYEVVVFVVH